VRPDGSSAHLLVRLQRHTLDLIGRFGPMAGESAASRYRGLRGHFPRQKKIPFETPGLGERVLCGADVACGGESVPGLCNRSPKNE